MRLLIGLLLLRVCAFAGNCGGATTCNCQDIVTSNYTLSADLTCPYNQDTLDGTPVLTLNTSSVTLNLNGHTISAANTYTAASWISDGTEPNQSGECIAVTSGKTGITITGGTISNCKVGINTSSPITISSMTISATYLNAIRLSAGASTITGVTLSGNFGYPLQIQSNSNAISSSTISNNYSDINVTAGSAIKFVGAVTGNTFTSVIVTDNSSAYVSSDSATISATNTFASCQFDNRKIPLFLFYASAASTPLYIGGMDTTNTADGLPIYMLSAASGTTYDGTSMGYFACHSCTNVTLKNATVTEVELVSNTGTTVQNVTGNVNVVSGSGNTVTTSTGSIRLATSNTNTISSNTLTGFTLNTPHGIAASGTGNIITGNTSRGFLLDVGAATATSNIILYPTGYSGTGSMIGWTDGTRTASVGGTVSFSFTMATISGAACPTCTYTITTSPSETVSSSLASSTVSGSFVPTKAGTYSVIVLVTDPSANEQKQNFLFLIGSTSSVTTRYYLRYGKSSYVAAGAGMDGQPMSLTAPSGTDYAGYCTGWVQHSPSAAPTYPYALLTGAAETLTYSGISGTPFVSLQRFSSYDTTVDLAHSTVATPSKYVYASASPTAFSSINWMMDGARAWNRLTSKLVSTAIKDPAILSTSGTPSYVDLTYTYATNPAVYSTANLDAVLVAATANSGTYTLDIRALATGSNTIVLTLTANRPYGVQIDSGSVTGTLADGSGLLSIATGSLSAGAHTVTVTQWPTAALSGTAKVQGGALIR